MLSQIVGVSLPFNYAGLNLKELSDNIYLLHLRIRSGVQ